MSTPESHYLTVTQEAGRNFFRRGLTGPVVMLNLLRFREIADYRESPALAPPAPISGAEAYQRYMRHTLPLLHKAGGEAIYVGDGGALLIGPTAERWDLVLLIRHRSVDEFMRFATDDAYLAGAGHRQAALADSRLLPTIERPR